LRVTPAELSRTVLSTVRHAVAARELRVAVPERVIVRRPPRPGCGDYATNVALQLAGPAGRTPRQVAEILSRRLSAEPGIALVEIAGPGFLNITLNAGAYADVVRQVRAQGAAYGTGDGLAGEAGRVVADEGAVRGRVVAEVVNRLLRAAGADPVPGDGAPEPLTVAEEAPGPDPAHDPFLRLGRDAARWALLRPPAEDPPRTQATAQDTQATAQGTRATAQATTPGPQAAAQATPQGPRAAAQPTTQGTQAAAQATAQPTTQGTQAAAQATAGAQRTPPSPLLAQRESNPLFRIRYVHARTRALLRNAHDLGVETESPVDDPYHHPAETELLGLIADFPRVIETAARRRAPDRLARHLERLADAFFRFHDECPALPKGDEKPSAVHAARIRLADATGIVLANGLHLLGISAPDRV
jgi:arginyl-tRNA synthetase